MSEFVNRVIDIYWKVPSLTKKILPIVMIEHMVASFCLNIAVYFKRVGYLQFTQIGKLISLYYWGCLFGALIGGGLCIKHRTTKISGIGLICISVNFLALFYSVNITILTISMFMLGLIGTMTATCNIASLVRSVGENEKAKLRIISLELILFNLSYSLVAFVLLDLSYNQIVTVAKCVFCLLLVLGVWSLSMCTDNTFNPQVGIGKSHSLFFPSRKKEFFLLMAMLICFGLIFSMVKVVFTPTLMDRFGGNLVSVVAASINPWVMFVFQPLIVSRVKSANSTWFLGGGGLLVGVGYFAFGVVDSFLLTLIVLVVLTFGEMMFAPLSKHFAIQLYGKGQDAVASGVWRAVFLGSGTIGPEISGYFANKYGAYSVWELCATLGVICFVFSLFLRRIWTPNPCSKIMLEV